jgi:MFS transporter, MHS family, shikimate and dehydroshikimate transport protein
MGSTRNNASSESSHTGLGRVVVASLTGTSLEWYDFFLYSTAAALVFGKIFFPGTSPALGVLLSLATFGVGFVARPFGALLFGVLGDRIGRRPSLVATLIMMGIATAGIGVLPDYAAIGLAAPVLLVVLRLVQGLGAGAEHAGATVFATEYAPARRRGLFGSASSSGLYVGVLLSSAIFALFELLPPAAFHSWGWRIPFLISAGLVSVGLFIRLRIQETPEFRRAERAEQDDPPTAAPASPLRSTFVHQWRSVLAVIGIVAGPFTATYAYQTYSLTYLSNNRGMGGVGGTVSLTVAAAVAVVAVPLAAAWSDRIGRRPVVIVGAVFSGLFAFPFFWLLDQGSPVAVAIAMIGGIGIGVPLMLGAQGALLGELFSTRNRFTGFAISRELGSMVFAGATPFIAAVLVDSAGGRPWPVSVYVIGACVITLVTGVLVRETRPIEHDVRTPAASATLG